MLLTTAVVTCGLSDLAAETKRSSKLPDFQVGTWTFSAKNPQFSSVGENDNAAPVG